MFLQEEYLIVDTDGRSDRNDNPTGHKNACSFSIERAYPGTGCEVERSIVRKKLPVDACKAYQGTVDSKQKKMSRLNVASQLNYLPYRNQCSLAYAR